MKLICTQENLKRVVYNCERVVSKQSTLPILNNILFEAEKGGLKLSATNLEIGIVAKIGAKVEKEGKITLPARLISNFSANLPAGENISLETNDNSMVLRSGSVKAVIKGLSAADFPLIPQKNTEYLLNISIAELRLILAKILVSVAINDARPELAGVNVNFGSREAFFASTDSFRLAEHRMDIEREQSGAKNYASFIEKRPNIIIPANTLIELNRLISNAEQGEVRIAIEEGQIFFEFDSVKLVSRLINGKYPEYKHILPKSYKTRVVGEKSALQNAVKMASIFSPGKTSEIALKINPGAKKIVVSAHSAEVGENSTELKFDVTGQAQEVVLNARYLLDGINTISTSKVAILINSESTPITLKEIDEQKGEILNDYTYIVMPIKS